MRNDNIVLGCIWKVLQAVNEHIVVTIIIISQARKTVFGNSYDLLVHRWRIASVGPPGLATLNLMMVWNTGKVPDDVDPAATQSAHLATM